MNGDSGLDIAKNTLIGGVMGAATMGVGFGFSAVGSRLMASGASAAGRMAGQGLQSLGKLLGGGCRNSFTPSTPVLMADGSKKAIADVKVGDKVLATDTATGKTGPGGGAPCT